MYIAFEGIDTAGKSTQINLLKQDLQKLKQIQKRFPDSGRIKRDIETIKEVLKSIEGGK